MAIEHPHDVAITLLGGFAVAVGGRPVDQSEWRRRQAAGLVKVLALADRRRMHREQVMDLLWPETPVAEAAPRLHKAAHYARRALGHPSSLVLAGESVALFPDDEVTVDATDFETAARAAFAAADPQSASRIADRYTGDLLPDDLYESWATDARERLRAVYLDLLRLAQRWQQLTQAEPADEEAHLKLITALARRGDRRAALRQFERLERSLRQELGVQPSRAAAALRERLLAAEAPATAATTNHIAALHVSPAARSSDAQRSATHNRPSEHRAGGRAPADRAPRPGLPPEPHPSGPGGSAIRAAIADRRRPLLVGATANLLRIEHLLDTVASGTGRTLFISGPAGVGKTALTTWLEGAAAERGMRVGSGAAAQVEGAWPYAPVLDALADMCRQHPTLLDGLGDSLREEIQDGLDGRAVYRPGASGPQRLFVAATELVRLAAAGAGAVLVVEDAHLADDASLRLIHYIARSTDGERVLVVVTHRPEQTASLARTRQGLLGRAAAITLDMKPLPYGDVRELIDRIVPGAAEGIVDAIWSASGGLPFAVVELARSVAEGRTPSARTWIPAAFSPEQVEALGAAAVLGISFDTDEFLSVAQLEEETAYRALDGAEAQRVLMRVDGGYEFRHALLRDAFLERMTADQLRTTHRRAARALELLGRPASRIAYHLVHAGDEQQAVPWVLRSVETLTALGAYREGLDALESVRTAAQGADRARLLALRADLLMAKADAGTLAAYRDAFAAATDPAERRRLRIQLARAATTAGDLETAAVALDGLEPDGSPEDADLLMARGSVALFSGDLETANAIAEQARREVVLGQPNEWQMFDLITLQGLVAHGRGQWFQHLKLELRHLIRRPAMAARIFDAHLCIAEVLLYGPTPYTEVLELTAALRETAERAGVLRAVAFASALRGETAFLAGDLGLAETDLRESIDLHREIGSAAGEAHSLQRLAEVSLARGNRGEANRLLQRAFGLARFSDMSLHLLHRVLGTMIVAAADPGAARGLVERAEATLGTDDHCPFCSIMLSVPAARACADVGDLDDARRYLAQAEASARMWEGFAWQASILEVSAHIARAEHRLNPARRLWREAAELFEASGQPLDAARCAAHAGNGQVDAGASPPLAVGTGRTHVPGTRTPGEAVTLPVPPWKWRGDGRVRTRTK